jgi:hypothetical protein
VRFPNGSSQIGFYGLRLICSATKEGSEARHTSMPAYGHPTREVVKESGPGPREGTFSTVDPFSLPPSIPTVIQRGTTNHENGRAVSSAVAVDRTGE